MLKKSAGVVLASLRGSTLKRVFRRPEALEGIFHSPRSILRANGLAKCGTYLLASSLAAAALDGLFEHLVKRSCASTIRKIVVDFEHKLIFPIAC